LRVLGLVATSLVSCFAAEPTIVTSAIAKVEILTITIPAIWTSTIIRAVDRDVFLAQPDCLLINGG
jgi:hypothetical protein